VKQTFLIEKKEPVDANDKPQAEQIADVQE
jgi:hypothetical protein